MSFIQTAIFKERFEAGARTTRWVSEGRARITAAASSGSGGQCQGPQAGGAC